MARDRPPSNWSGSSNPDRDFARRESDGWSTDGSTHGGHVSSSGVPDVSGVGPETNAFLWALEGQPDPFTDIPATQFTGQLERLQPDQPQSGQGNQIEPGFEYAADDSYPELPAEPEPVGYPSSKEFFADAEQRPREDFFEEVPYEASPQQNYQQNGSGRTSSRSGFDEEDDVLGPEGYFEYVETYDPSASGQFSERNYGSSHEYSEEQLRLTSYENVDPPQHREQEPWFNPPSRETISLPRQNTYEPVPEVDDYRFGIERDLVSDDFRDSGHQPGLNRRGGYDYDYEDEAIERPARKQVRRPSRNLDEGYVVEDKTKSHGLRDQLVEIIFLVVPTMVLVLLVRSFVVSPFLIPTPSMDPTLAIGDRVLVNKLSYRVGDVGRGDIVVVRLDTDTGEKTIIKRAIGLPDETVEIRDNKVIINGQLALEESDYLEDDVVSVDFGPVQVPSDEIFLLGDNRLVSDDSSKDLGPVPVDRVVGRAFVRFLPLGRFGSL